MRRVGLLCVDCEPNAAACPLVLQGGVRRPTRSAPGPTGRLRAPAAAPAGQAQQRPLLAAPSAPAVAASRQTADVWPALLQHPHRPASCRTGGADRDGGCSRALHTMAAQPRGCARATRIDCTTSEMPWQAAASSTTAARGSIPGCLSHCGLEAREEAARQAANVCVVVVEDALGAVLGTGNTGTEEESGRQVLVHDL